GVREAAVEVPVHGDAGPQGSQGLRSRRHLRVSGPEARPAREGIALDADHMLAIGVQTWGTDVAALRRYWKIADELGYARITYGDGLGEWTHDGWTMLGALATLTRRARIGPAVTYAFDASSHHPSWLAKRAVAVDHLSDGRLDLRLAVGAEDEAAARGWSSFGIRYPPAGERIETLAETIQVIRGLWRTHVGFDHPGPPYAPSDTPLRP